MRIITGQLLDFYGGKKGSFSSDSFDFSVQLRMRQKKHVKSFRRLMMLNNHYGERESKFPRKK